MLLKIHACKFAGCNNLGKHMQREKQTESPFCLLSWNLWYWHSLSQYSPPFFTLRNKSHFLLREFYGWDRSCPHAIQRKKETGVCIPISKHHICLQQGAVFQSNHARNSVIIVLLFQNIPVAWAVWGLKCATLTSVPQLPWLQVSWAFLLSIGFHTDILPLTSIKPLSHNMLPHSASWFVFKWSSSHKPNDSLQFYKHIHVCCQTHELVFCRLLQESSH